MEKLQRADLWSLEHYAEKRAGFRQQVMEHKSRRRLPLGEHATLYFEDRLSIQYQVQEMLRVERIFEPAAIEEELAAYNPLIPDGDNWKATFMLEYPDRAERQQRCRELVGIEHRVWVQIGEGERVYAIADEDLSRATEDKTSAVHFLRFQLNAEQKRQALDGAPLHFGVDHPLYQTQVLLPEPVRQALCADLH
ncbi:MAG: DUF3501 family protein [Acidithiobacillus caldus]|nr:DUF3501 family protein [Acidithiobacillus caldus]